jgi:hypothetical protein
MKTYLLAFAAPALALSAPAAAQYQTYPPPAYPSARVGAEVNARLDARIEALEDRLDAGIQSGIINRAEARSLRAQLRALVRLQGQYSYNGLTRQERADLQQRIRALRQEMRLADGGAYDRYDRYAHEDGNQGYYGRGGPYDSDGDGWDDRDCDRDGDIDSGSCDTRRGGIGGFIESILGVGGLRVGQRVTGELYGLPPQYQDRFRDGYGYVYRSDGRRIYQIDARTDTVVRIYPM